MKKKVFYFGMLLFAMLVFTGCPDPDHYKEGQKAGKEFCECMKDKNNESTCKDRMERDYKSFLGDDEFYEGANTNSCGYEFWKIIKKK